MSTIIRTRSPFFIRTPQETDANLSYFQINITVASVSIKCPQLKYADDLYAHLLTTEKTTYSSENSQFHLILVK